MTSPGSHEGGFTLVEVLVSLAIFSLAIVGLNRAATLAVSGTTDLVVRTHSGIVADNTVVLMRLEPVEVGTDRREAESGGLMFDVAIETSRTEVPNFYEMQIRVSERGKTRILTDRRAFLSDQPASSKVGVTQ